MHHSEPVPFNDAVPSAPGAVPAALPFNEQQRLDALHGYRVLDTAPEQAYDDLTTLAAAVCGTPVALISLVDVQRQWFKARRGLEPNETARDLAFCAHAILTPDRVFEVPDARLDDRFATNPLVTGEPHVRFYAGTPLLTPQGLPIGTVCVIDHVPRQLDDTQRSALESLARQVVAQLELRRVVSDLEVDSLTDGLTALWNRRYFDRRLKEEWMRHARSGKPLALLMVDLDHFKRVNDTHGHPAGDAVLAKAAEVLRTSVRQTDVVTRFGGEEFAIILPETDADNAVRVGLKIREAFHTTHWPQCTVTASMGVSAAAPVPGANPLALVAQADRALYRAKETGRDRVERFAGWQ
ncbi:MAG: sensor domain-containing diguanylate cyclase [Pseudomonadota bacterium]